MVLRILTAIPRLMAAIALFAALLPGDSWAGPADVPGLVLRLDADEAHVQRDSDDLVSGWSDVTDTATNTTPDHVAQKDLGRRPRWVDKAIGGRPAIQFDGGDFLSNTANNLVAAGSVRTVFVVGRLDDRSPGAMLFAFRRSTSAEKPLFGVTLYAHKKSFLVYTDGSHGDNNTPVAKPGIVLKASTVRLDTQYGQRQSKDRGRPERNFSGGPEGQHRDG